MLATAIWQIRTSTQVRSRRLAHAEGFPLILQGCIFVHPIVTESSAFRSSRRVMLCKKGSTEETREGSSRDLRGIFDVRRRGPDSSFLCQLSQLMIPSLVISHSASHLPVQSYARTYVMGPGSEELITRRHTASVQRCQQKRASVNEQQNDHQSDVHIPWRHIEEAQEISSRWMLATIVDCQVRRAKHYGQYE